LVEEAYLPSIIPNNNISSLKYFLDLEILNHTKYNYIYSVILVFFYVDLNNDNPIKISFHMKIIERLVYFNIFRLGNTYTYTHKNNVIFQLIMFISIGKLVYTFGGCVS